VVFAEQGHPSFKQFFSADIVFGESEVYPYPSTFPGGLRRLFFEDVGEHVIFASGRAIRHHASVEFDLQTESKLVHLVRAERRTAHL